MVNESIAELMCLCGGSAYKTLLSGKYIEGSESRSRDFAVAKCMDCGLARTVPPPYQCELEAKIYQEFSYKDAFENAALWSSFFQPVIQTAQRHKKSGRFLDIGCGSGFMLKMAAESGFETYGVELNRDAARYGKEVHELNIIPLDLASANFPDDFFDVITLSQVLEHIAQPEGLFSEIRRVLKSDGIMIVDSPNMGGMVVPFWGDKWSGFQPQWHVWQFTPATLANLLQHYGFDIVESICSHNIHVNLPKQPLKRLIRCTLYRLMEIIAEFTNRADKVMIVAQQKSGDC